MSTSNLNQEIDLKVVWPIVLAGGLLGGIISFGVMSGDAQGRVNLLYLIFVYLFIPILSVIISCFSLIKGKGFNLARVIVWLPLWSNQKKNLIRKTQQLKVEKFWLFYQSQLAALAFSFISVSVFLILLITTDINFVWRSTLLGAKELYPILDVLAAPWFFWDNAQPSLALLQSTQDSRLLGIHNSNLEYGHWWRFVLAVQLFYCVFLRTLLLLITAAWYRFKTHNDIEQQLSHSILQHPQLNDPQQELAVVISQIPTHLTINNWAGIDAELLSDFNLDWSKDNQLQAGPLVNDSQQRVAERWQGPQLIIVKAWEPPLGELKDFMANGKGVVIPLDWKNRQLIRLRREHLQEWQRFVKTLTNWELCLPKELMPEEQL